MRTILTTALLLISLFQFCISAKEISENNDKYWYNYSLDGKFDSNGDIIQSSITKNVPASGSFEIQFAYSDDENAPVSIYLNTIDDEKVIASKKLGSIIKRVSGSVVYSSDKVDIFIPDYHICVLSDGNIIIYHLKNGEYKNAEVSMYQPNEVASMIYGIRYEVLVKKLKELF